MQTLSADKWMSMKNKEGSRTNAALSVILIDAEHGNVSPEVPFAVGRLFTDYGPNRMRDTFGVSLRMSVSTP